MTGHEALRKEQHGSTKVGTAGGEYLRPPAAARYCGLSESKLAKMRMRHSRERGPRFLKIGSVVMYRRAELDAWLDSHIVEFD